MTAPYVIATFVVVLIGVIHAWSPSYYPQYCLKDLNERKIPPLTAAQQAKVASLEQVQVLIRHGARTPYMKYPCWEDYSVTWNNCNVTELMLASPTYTDPNRPSPWLFRKLYDGSPDALGGNCYTGQLISEGYNQEIANGEFLRQAYLESSMPLFNTSIWTDINTDELIYLRSDDEQRTLMSGQLLLHGMFNVSQEIIVPWHTGDYSLDQIYPNSNVCPRLDTLEDSIYATDEFVATNTSHFSQTLNFQLDNIFGAGAWSWQYTFDCIMTTICTNRPLPEGGQTPAKVYMNETIFNNTLAHVEWQYAYLNRYNDSQWAKLAMGNTAWHVRTNLLNALYNSTSSAKSNTPLKMALFSGHDTTIQPFLAAVLRENWDGRWPAYASMVTIELYRTIESETTPAADPVDNYLFRIVYNAKVMTVPGCPDTLCTARLLVDALSFGQENMPCSVTPDSIADDDEDSDNCDSDESPLSTGIWVTLVMLSLLIGGLVGAGVMVFVEKHRQEKSQRDFVIAQNPLLAAAAPSGSLKGSDASSSVRESAL